MSNDLAWATNLATFPWPFTSDSYRYSANLEPAPAVRTTEAGSWGGSVLDADEHYEAELAERARVLAAHPNRLGELPHMRAASWETLLHLLSQLAATYPWASLTADGDHYVWTNDRLGTRRAFTYGDDTTLPEGPLVFAGRQVQEDIALLDQREGDLFVDAGLVTFASNWSLAFNTGMSFLEIHGPVPRNYADGALPRAQTFLTRLQPGQAYRRTNWTSTVGKRLDTSLETYDSWGADRGRVLDGDLGATYSMRVEVQHLIRLPQTHAIVFLIRTYIIALDEIAQVPEWARQFAAVLADLPDELADYKGFRRTRSRTIDWLQAHAG